LLAISAKAPVIPNKKEFFMSLAMNPAVLDKLPEQIAELLSHGGTLGAAYDYTDQDYELLYALGHQLYSQARYEEAMKTFSFLVMHNHLDKRFMNALASSHQMLKSYLEAVKYYSLASLMDMSDPLPTFHTAECFIALGQTADAKEALQFVIAQCKTPDRAALQERAQAVLELLNRAADTPAPAL
jgi:type III secretion system low calcium response chaperone LcrH/SycD